MADFIDHSDETSSAEYRWALNITGVCSAQTPVMFQSSVDGTHNLEDEYALGSAGLICGILSLFKTVLRHFPDGNSGTVGKLMARQDWLGRKHATDADCRP